jgi:hypothetical protein
MVLSLGLHVPDIKGLLEKWWLFNVASYFSRYLSGIMGKSSDISLQIGKLLVGRLMYE